MNEGRVKWYSEKKGDGFIHTEEYRDVFVHKSGIKEFGHFGLQEGDPVCFELKETPKRHTSHQLNAYKILLIWKRTKFLYVNTYH